MSIESDRRAARVLGPILSLRRFRRGPTANDPASQSTSAQSSARAHIQRRQFDQAIANLLDAEKVAPEHLRSHSVAHQTVSDLLQQQGRDAPDDLIDLGKRLGVTI